MIEDNQQMVACILTREWREKKMLLNLDLARDDNHNENTIRSLTD
jgi:hypothetical protein